MIAYWSHKVIKSCNLWLMLDLWPLKYPCPNKSPNLSLQKCKQQHLDKLKEVKTPWILDGASSCYHSMIAYYTKLQFVINPWPLTLKISLHQHEPKLISTETRRSKNTMGTWWRIQKLLLDGWISHKVIKSYNLWLMLDLWPLKYPCANMSLNLFLQTCKQQHLDKPKELKAPWVLVGATNSGNSMIAYWLCQLTKRNILWFVLDLWPLKILAPKWTHLYCFRKANSSTEIN